MKRRTISRVLVASLSFSIGCYSTGMVTKEDLKTRAGQIDITVLTRDSLKYQFSKDHYRIQGDTLTGWSRVPVPSSNVLSFQERVARLESGHPASANTFTRDSVVASIAIADITSLETEEFDGWATTALVALVVPALYFLVAIIAVSITPGK